MNTILVNMKTIQHSYLINARPEKVFEALTVPRIIEKWSYAAAIMDDQPGTDFSLWDGSIFGTNLEVIPNQKLVQHWYAGEWETPSKVTFMLREAGDKTEVVMTQENIPEKSFDSISKGWDTYYLGPIKDMFETAS